MNKRNDVIMTIIGMATIILMIITLVKTPSGVGEKILTIILMCIIIIIMVRYLGNSMKKTEKMYKFLAEKEEFDKHWKNYERYSKEPSKKDESLEALRQAKEIAKNLKITGECFIENKTFSKKAEKDIKRILKDITEKI